MLGTYGIVSLSQRFIFFCVGIPTLILLTTVVRAEEESTQFSPSFPCEKATTVAERLICSSEELSALDAELSTFVGPLTRRLPRNQYYTQSRKFVEKRAGCGEDVTCMAAAYKARIWTVRGIVDDRRAFEGVWVSPNESEISIIKRGSVFQVRAKRLRSLDEFCRTQIVDFVEESFDIDAFEADESELSGQLTENCLLTVWHHDDVLDIELAGDCADDAQSFRGAYRHGEASNPEFLCLQN